MKVTSEVLEALVKSANKIQYYEHDLKLSKRVKKGQNLVLISSREVSLEKMMSLHIQFTGGSVDVENGLENKELMENCTSVWLL